MFTRISTIALISLTLGACDTSPKSSFGFALPDGDATVGQNVFVKMECNSCHSVEGIEALREGVDPEMTILLGGKTTRIATYGELVTSVINPSHKLAKGYRFEKIVDGTESKMRNYNDVMTVSELIDLVAFLQDQYEVYVPPKTGHYP